MSEIMLAMYEASDKLASVFVGTADGNMVLVNERSGIYIDPDGSARTLNIRERPWYVQASEAGEMIFTGVEIDAYTDNPMLECAAPVYYNGELVAVVAADIYLNSISEYVEGKASEGSFICVVSDSGEVLFSPQRQGIFKPAVSSEARDLRKLGNDSLAEFIDRALAGYTGLQSLEIDGTEYFVSGAPLPTVGWAVLTVVDKRIISQPTETMLANYERINDAAFASFEDGARKSTQTILVLTLVIILLAVIGALTVEGHQILAAGRSRLRDGRLLPHGR